MVERSTKLAGRVIRRRVLQIATILVTIVVAAACSSGGSSDGTGSNSGSTGTLDNFTVALAGVGVNLADMWIAQTKGFYTAVGLNVNLEQVNSNVVALVTGGRADIASSGLSSSLAPVTSGVQTTMVYAQTSATVSAFVAGASNVKSIKDCKTVATNAVGSATYAYTLLYAHITGAKFQVIPVSNPSALASTLTSGHANCGISSYDFLRAALTNGFHLIVNPEVASTRPPGLITAGAGQGVWGVRDHLIQKRADVVKFLTAVRMADKWMASASPEAIATQLRKSSDWQDIPAATISDEVKTIKSLYAPNDGAIPQDSWQSDIAYFGYVISDFNGSDPQWSYSQRVDMSYLNAVPK
jgi:NMT1/THI5 like